MALTNIARRLTASELAREPRMCHIVAWFDGYSQGSNPNATPATYARRLTPDEGREWREGYAEGRRERVCHAWHGFIPCRGDHDHRMPRTDEVTLLDHYLTTTDRSTSR